MNAVQSTLAASASPAPAGIAVYQANRRRLANQVFFCFRHIAACLAVVISPLSPGDSGGGGVGIRQASATAGLAIWQKLNLLRLSVRQKKLGMAGFARNFQDWLLMTVLGIGCVRSLLPEGGDFGDARVPPRTGITRRLSYSAYFVAGLSSCCQILARPSEDQWRSTQLSSILLGGTQRAARFRPGGWLLSRYLIGHRGLCFFFPAFSMVVFAMVVAYGIADPARSSKSASSCGVSIA